MARSNWSNFPSIPVMLIFVSNLFLYNNRFCWVISRNTLVTVQTTESDIEMHVPLITDLLYELTTILQPL